MDMYTDEQLIDMYTERKYKRWVKQKIKLRVRLMLIFLLLFINIILVFILIFNRDECECLDVNNCLEISNIEENVEEYEYEEEYVNVIPGRYAFLTFDDGPSVYTQKILDVLNNKNAPAIFFVQGESINNRSDAREILNLILEEGHYIGLHTMSHDHDILYRGEGAPQRFVNEMFELDQLIYEMTGFSTNLCRAAYGMARNFTPEHHVAVDRAGLYCIDWNIDSRDWEQRTAYMVYQNVTNQIEGLDFPDELVILFHEHLWTAEALPGIIDYLRLHGYTIAVYNPGDILIYYRFR